MEVDAAAMFLSDAASQTDWGIDTRMDIFLAPAPVVFGTAARAFAKILARSCIDHAVVKCAFSGVLTLDVMQAEMAKIVAE
eukprot:10335045-Karenia_brevis.AAC.1